MIFFNKYSAKLSNSYDNCTNVLYINYFSKVFKNYSQNNFFSIIYYYSNDLNLSKFQ